MGRLPSHNAAQAPKGRSECVGIRHQCEVESMVTVHSRDQRYTVHKRAVGIRHQCESNLPLESFFLVASPSVQLSTAGRFSVMRQGSLLWSMAEGVHAKPQ